MVYHGSLYTTPWYTMKLVLKHTLRHTAIGESARKYKMQENTVIIHVTV